MATLSYLFTEDGEYVCDEVPNVILYWDSAPAEFRCRRASVPGWYPTMSYGKTITTFLKSETVALYRGELPEKKEPTQDVTRIEAIECNIKTIAQQQNVYHMELQDLQDRVIDLKKRLVTLEAVTTGLRFEDRKGVLELYDSLKKRVIDLERAAVKPHIRGKAKKVVETIGVYEGGKKLRNKSRKPVPPKMRQVEEGGW